MIRMILSAAAALFLGIAASAQTAPPPAAIARPPVKVALTTAQGVIVVELDREHAPVTSANFLRYVDRKRFDGITFYRAVKAALNPPLGFIQAGTQANPARTLPPIRHESTTITGLAHVDGAISMARWAPGTAAGDFTILVGAAPSMDAHPDQAGDNQGFAVFGHVVAGMDVVLRVLDLPTSPTQGEGVMKGQMLSPPLRIVTARRVP